jgi:hypothetical protein
MRYLLIPSFARDNDLFVWVAKNPDLHQIVYPIQNVGQLIFIDLFAQKMDVDALADRFARETNIDLFSYPGSVRIVLIYEDSEFAIYLMIVQHDEENGFFTYKDSKYVQAGWTHVNTLHELMNHENIHKHTAYSMYKLLYGEDRTKAEKILRFVKKNYSRHVQAIEDLDSSADTDAVCDLINVVTRHKTNNKYYNAAALFLYHNRSELLEMIKELSTLNPRPQPPQSC